MEPETKTSPAEIPDTKKESFWKELIKFTFLAVVIVVPIRTFIAQPFIVSGASMDPTFWDGEYLIVDEISYRFEEPKRGEVVIFKYPKDQSKFFIKRLIGLPGETVAITGTAVTIYNSEHPEGKTLDERYINENNLRSNSLKITLRSNEYFVMGDNRAASFDSRDWGPLDRNLFVGRALFRLFPLQKLNLFPGKAVIE